MSKSSQLSVLIQNFGGGVLNAMFSLIQLKCTNKPTELMKV